jgi:hypothetical protein
MRSSRIFPLLLLGISSVCSAAAETPEQFEKLTWELGGGATGSFSLSAPTSGSNTTTTTISGMVGYFLKDGFEVLVSPYVGVFSGSGTQTSLGLLVGPEYNFNKSDVGDSFYAALQAGITFESESGGFSSSTFEATAIIGRRFEMLEHICWSPSVEYVYYASVPHFNGLTLTPLALSVIF